MRLNKMGDEYVMESTEADNLILYQALRVIKDTCLKHPTRCKECPLSIEIHKIDSNNKGYSYFACRVYNQQYPNISRPGKWDLKPPTGYSPFSDS